MRDANALRHEHAIPRRVLIARLLQLSSPSPLEIEGLLSGFCVGVVVTRDEDRMISAHGLRQRMPLKWNGKDIWARYRIAGITPIDTSRRDGA